MTVALRGGSMLMLRFASDGEDWKNFWPLDVRLMT